MNNTIGGIKLRLKNIKKILPSIALNQADTDEIVDILEDLKARVQQRNRIKGDYPALPKELEDKGYKLIEVKYKEN